MYSLPQDQAHEVISTGWLSSSFNNILGFRFTHVVSYND
jgi:hypothetical protein